MTRWTEFGEQAPELAARVEELFGANKYLTMATIRKDGGPRISGTEVSLTGGELYLPAMSGTWRFRDLRRDPRVAVHSGPLPEDRWRGDAKVSGRAVELTGTEQNAYRAAHPGTPEGPFELFRVELTEAAVVRLEGDPPVALLVESWRPGEEVRQVRRD